jgi:Rps23 Pro-64 3,4-dihydroxylase Tpa1-like proline 4-hydroxylase
VLSKQTIENLDNYQQHYSQHGWVQIPNYYDLKVVEDCYQHLAQFACDMHQWQLATLVQGKPFMAQVNKYLDQPPQVRSHFIAELLRYAQQNDFQYFYEFIRLLSDHDKTPAHLSDMAAMIESNDNLKTLKEIISNPAITQIDAQITGYKPGHFLKRHSDEGYQSEHQRKAAYVLSLSKQWQPDWGGLLHLMDDEGTIEHTITPTFNTMVMFKVPTPHFVSQVTNYCPDTRFSITGWLWE